MLRLIRIQESSRPTKKYSALFSDGTRIHFGGKGCMDYIRYYAKFGKDVASRKRKAYIARHVKGKENWKNPKTAGTLSRYILWEYPTLKQATKAFKKKFSV